MKLMRCPAVLLAAALLQVATAHRGPRRKAAALLRAGAHRGAAAPVAGDASGALGGILDAVTYSFAAVRTELGTVDASCQDELGASSARAQSHASAIAGLSASRVENLARAAGLQAELEHLAGTEANTQTSYDSAVARRASEAQAFNDVRAASAKQQDVLSQVLQHLRRQREVAAALGAGNASGNLSSASSPQSSQLDYVIGVFHSLLGTVTQGGADQEAEHAQQDAQLMSLVGSYTDSLHRIDAQYEAKNAEKSAAQAAAEHAATEAAMRGEAVSVEEAAAASLRQLCSPGGEVQRATAAGEQDFVRALSDMKRNRSRRGRGWDFLQAVRKAVASLKTQVEQTLLTLDALAQWAETANTTGTNQTDFLQGFLQEGSSQRRSLRPAAPPPPRGAERWLAEARAHGLRPLPPVPTLPSQPRAVEDSQASAVEAVAASLPDRRLAEALRSLPLAALLRTRGAAALGSVPSAASDASQDCVQEKQRLAAEVLASRQAERLARAQEAEGRAAVAAVDGWLPLLGQEETALGGAQARLDNAWVPPVHLQLGGSVTHASASSACSGQGGRLCLAREVCPRGDLSLGPLGSAVAGQQWAPVQDSADEWVHVGSLDYGTCLYSSALPSPLTWMVSGAEDAAKDHVLCCGVGAPLASIQSLETVLGDATRELQEVKANLTTFLSLGSPPLASGLPGALDSIGSALAAMQAQWPQESNALVGLYNNLQGQYSSALGRLVSNVTSLQAQQGTANASLTSALAAVQAEEANQQALTAQQALNQARCEAVLNASSASTTPAPAPVTTTATLASRTNSTTPAPATTSAMTAPNASTIDGGRL